ncbi:MAG: hypothetical protein ACREQC_16150, partial [Candidatus Binataceae bacterium]
GQGIASFQESGVVNATFVGAVPTVAMLGLYPTVQTLAAQGILLLLAFAALFRPSLRRVSETSEPHATPHAT